MPPLLLSQRSHSIFLLAIFIVLGGSHLRHRHAERHAARRERAAGRDSLASGEVAERDVPIKSGATSKGARKSGQPHDKAVAEAPKKEGKAVVSAAGVPRGGKKELDDDGGTAAAAASEAEGGVGVGGETEAIKAAPRKKKDKSTKQAGNGNAAAASPLAMPTPVTETPTSGAPPPVEPPPVDLPPPPAPVVSSRESKADAAAPLLPAPLPQPPPVVEVETSVVVEAVPKALLDTTEDESKENAGAKDVVAAAVAATTVAAAPPPPAAEPGRKDSPRHAPSHSKPTPATAAMGGVTAIGGVAAITAVTAATAVAPAAKLGPQRQVARTIPLASRRSTAVPGVRTGGEAAPGERSPSAVASAGLAAGAAAGGAAGGAPRRTCAQVAAGTALSRSPTSPRGDSTPGATATPPPRRQPLSYLSSRR